MLTTITALSIALGLTANAYKLYNQRPSAEVQPFTGEWYKLCSERYRSFDPKTGLFTTRSGKKVFCRWKKRKAR